MLSCQEVIKILNSDQQLSTLKKMSLKMHIFMCKHCHAYKKHLETLKKQVMKVIAKDSKVDSKKVEELEKKIYENVKKDHINS